MLNKVINFLSTSICKFILLTVMCLAPFSAFSAGDKIEYPKQEWSFSGVMGTFDRASQQEVFKFTKRFVLVVMV